MVVWNNVGGPLETTLVVVWKKRWWLFGNQHGGWLEWTLVVVWNCRWWLFGMGVDGCLEPTMVVVWNCRWWLFGIVVGGCLELSLLPMKQPTWTIGIVVDGCLEWNVGVWNCHQRWCLETTTNVMVVWNHVGGCPLELSLVVVSN